MKRWDIIEIDWIDSTHTSGWTPISEAENTPIVMGCKSIGYFFRETAEALQIVQSSGLDGYSPQIDALMTIPKVAIKRKRVIK